MRKTLKLILITLFFGISLNGYSQTKDEAGKAYNQGIEYVKSDEPEKAIASLENAIDICNKVGFEADDLKAMAEQQLPAQYYKSATALYKAKKIDEAISRYEKTVDVAKKYNDADIEKKSNKMIPQLYNLKGTSYYKKKDYENALKYFDISTQKDSDFAKGYYSKGLTYNKLKDAVKMKESFDLAILKAEAKGSTKTVAKSKKAAKKYLVNFAVKSIQNEKITDALMYLDQAGEYGEGDANTYYYYAIAYNKKSKWDDAIIAANKGLELEKDAKAKIYFELGTALHGKGDNAAACNAYKEAAYGEHIAQANYQIKEVLKCQ